MRNKNIIPASDFDSQPEVWAESYDHFHLQGRAPVQQ